MDYTESIAFATPWFDVVARTLALASEPYYSLRMADYVTVCAVTSEGRFVLVRQYRPAVGKWTPRFRKRVVTSKLDLYALLARIKVGGARVYGIGAPSRASTLINYYGLDDGILDCVLEVKNSLKLGKYMPGTLIPVLEESRLYEDQPEYALLLSWHIADELIPKLKQKGYRGKFIVPLPSPEIRD